MAVAVINAKVATVEDIKANVVTAQVVAEVSEGVVLAAVEGDSQAAAVLAVELIPEDIAR
jgi:hypothetical protein